MKYWTFGPALINSWSFYGNETIATMKVMGHVKSKFFDMCMYVVFQCNLGILSEQLSNRMAAVVALATDFLQLFKCFEKLWNWMSSFIFSFQYWIFSDVYQHYLWKQIYWNRYYLKEEVYISHIFPQVIYLKNKQWDLYLNCYVQCGYCVGFDCTGFILLSVYSTDIVC